MAERKPIRIFFSWQSDLPKSTSTNAIRAAIRSALNEIENSHPDLSITLEEATSNAPGSPDIPAMIFERISNTDIFISDITTINASTPDRKSANPNVLIELGYALSELGTDRLILLFNQAYGVFPNDVCFDVDRKRIASYRLADKNDKAAKQELSKLLQKAIELIIEHNPLRPNEKKALSPEKQKRNRDIENLRWIMGKFSMSMLERHIEITPDSLDTRIGAFYDEFRAILASRLFHLYDKEALQLLQEVEKDWTGTLISETYRDTASKNIQKFGNVRGIPLSKKDKKDYEDMLASREKLIISFGNLVNYIRDKYLELDLNALSNQAWDEFLKHYNS